MGVNLQLLGIQAIHRPAKRLNVQVKLPRWPMLFGTSPKIPE